jgi:hypothetical protein
MTGNRRSGFRAVTLIYAGFAGFLAGGLWFSPGLYLFDYAVAMVGIALALWLALGRPLPGDKQ